jgi:hypothetical protein
LIDNLGPFEVAPMGQSRTMIKIVSEDAAPRLWPVPRPGCWENPAGVSYSRVAHLESMRDQEVADWVAEHQVPGTIALVAGAPGREAGEADGSPRLYLLVNDTPSSPERRQLAEEVRAEHFQRTGLRPPGNWGGEYAHAGDAP